MKNEIIMASAGSGKTYRLSNRIITILLDGVDPRKVIALTFTRKAAGEFSSALFEKIAEAASDPKKAAQICQDIQRPEQYQCSDFLALLEKVVEVLPEMYLGTLDSYFTRIIQAFQFELGLSTGSGVKILEGSELEELKAEILNEILFTQEEETSTKFLQAFKMASFGKEEVAVSQKMDSFVDDWHRHYLSHGQEKWGNASLVTEGKELTPWHRQDIPRFINTLESIFGEAAETNAKISNGIDTIKEELRTFSGGSGRLAKMKTFFDNSLKIKEELLSGIETSLQFHKKIPLTGQQALQLGEIITALCEEELFVKAIHSKALWDILQRYEKHYEKHARQMGKLSFNDIKYLLGRWQESEESRVTRELIDYRLDARHDHWLLDEFQDTSKDQFDGLKPLLDEVATNQTGERSLFVVGDVKQSIYQWRGGDPKLFDQVAKDYGISPVDMSQSYRSQQAVLSLVNHICGNQAVMRSCFGDSDAVERWKWNDHVQACAVKSAYSEVRFFKEEEEKMEHLLELLHESKPTQRGLSCAILIRDNKKVSTYAEALRSKGFPVAEEGRVKPTQDNPVGLLLLDLIKWISNPSDLFAQRHLQLSPLGEKWSLLRDDPITLWKEWNMMIFYKGLFATLKELLSPLKHTAFGADRLRFLLEEVRAYTGEQEALIRHLENLEVSVAESSNVIQVMTIHQSKGLGFDMVILPEIPDKTAAHSGKFEMAKVNTPAGNTIFSPPASGVRSFFLPLSDAEEQWKQEQYYEAFCVLYVALTRAKRGLYLFLPKEPKSTDNFAKWIYEALPDQGAEDESLLFQEGEEAWFQHEPIAPQQPEKSTPALPQIPTKRGRSFVTHTSLKRKAFTNNQAIERGLRLHEVMERITWLSDLPTELKEHKYSAEIEPLLVHEEIRTLLTKPEGDVQLFREQTIEWIDNEGLWNTARLDRFSVLLKDGIPQRITLLDFKTDDVEDPVTLRKRHTKQLQHYEKALRSLYGEEIPIEKRLINVTYLYVV